MKNHPTVIPKDNVDDVIHYLRYVTKFAPSNEQIPLEPTPASYLLLVILLGLTATIGASALSLWVVSRIASKFIGW